MMTSKYTPTHQPINLNEPTAADLLIDDSLKAYMDVAMKLETDEEMARRAHILIQVEQIFLAWVRTVAVEVLHLPEDEALAAGGKLFVSGSHKLGVREPGADIDTVCVAPNFCTREHFFTLLKEDFKNHSKVTEFNSIETAQVPIMSFDFDGVSIDLLFARLSDNSVPDNLDILDDSILNGLDDATEKSLNGPRVTMMIAELVGKSTFPNFLIVLRCVRRWAKRRGLYGNKLGYMGGINCNILVAFVCQLYPKASPSTLLAKFFRVYADWQWPKPVMLNQIMLPPPTAFAKKVVWNEEIGAYHHMPIITPAYPAMNSSEKVTRHSRTVIQQEMARANNLLRTIIAEREQRPTGVGSERSLFIDWERLFEPSDFFLRYSHYLACNIIGTGDDHESRQWIGFVESRILGFAKLLENLPLKHPIHLFPIVSKTEKSANSICYFVGFDVDMKVANKSQGIHVDVAVNRFLASLWDEQWGYRGVRKEGLDFFVEHMTWKRLPQSVFDSMGGREVAKVKRNEILGLISGTTSASTTEGVAGGQDGSTPNPASSSTSATQESSLANVSSAIAADIKSEVASESTEVTRKRSRSDELATESSKTSRKVKQLLPPFCDEVWFGKKGDDSRAVSTEAKDYQENDQQLIKNKVVNSIIDLTCQAANPVRPYCRITSVTWSLLEK